MFVCVKYSLARGMMRILRRGSWGKCQRYALRHRGVTVERVRVSY